VRKQRPKTEESKTEEEEETKNEQDSRGRENEDPKQKRRDRKEQHRRVREIRSIGPVRNKKKSDNESNGKSSRDERAADLLKMTSKM
jgi:hypothetical protein